MAWSKLFEEGASGRRGACKAVGEGLSSLWVVPGAGEGGEGGGGTVGAEEEVDAAGPDEGDEGVSRILDGRPTDRTYPASFEPDELESSFMTLAGNLEILKLNAPISWNVRVRKKNSNVKSEKKGSMMSWREGVGN